MFETISHAPTPCRVARGDSLVLLRDLPTGCCDMLLTDPPYCSGGPKGLFGRWSRSFRFRLSLIVFVPAPTSFMLAPTSLRRQMCIRDRGRSAPFRIGGEPCISILSIAL